MKVCYFLMICVIHLVIFSCKQHENEFSTFNLIEDCLNFSTKMNEGDTLFMYADLSLCMSSWIESSYLYKKGGKIYLAGKIIAHSHLKKPLELSEIEYTLQQNDSLCFEKLFQSLDTENLQKNTTPIITISYKQDTMKLYGTDLTNHSERIYFYGKIKQKLYPNEKFYQPTAVPIDLK
jgi:hypothetical protein